MLENIDRIEKPSIEDFHHNYVLAQRPVIIRNLFAGQPIAALDTLEAARAVLGTMPVKIFESFEDTFLRLVESLHGMPNFDRRSVEGTMDDYLRLVTEDPATRRICSQVPRTHFAPLRALYQVPELCLRDPQELEEELWLAQAGNYSHLHFDDDQRNVLQYNLFGRKRFLLVDPRQSKKLLPVQQNCMVSPDNVSDDENDDFVRYVKGWQCVLEPGEALLFPALMWHSVKYLDTSMAVTFRFWRNHYNRFMANNVAADYKQQTLSWKLVNEAAIAPEMQDAFQRIEQVCRTSYPSLFDRGEAIRAVIDEQYERVCTDSVRGSYARPFADVLKKRIDQFAYFAYQFAETNQPGDPPR